MITEMMTKLKQTNSHPEKVAILKRYDCEFIRQVLTFMYDPNKVYHMTGTHAFAKDINENNFHKDELNLLDDLENCNLTGLAANEAVKNNRIKHGGLVDLILSKDLKCGISITTINKAFPKLIPLIKLQKASPLPLEKVKFPCYAETKYDGVRLAFIVTSNGVTVLTYNNKPVNLPNFKKQFSMLPEGLYDGELIFSNGKSNTRTNVSGMVNSAIHGGNIAEGSLTFMVFDCLSLKELKEEKCMLTYERRRARLQEAIAQVPFPLIRIAKSERVESVTQVNEMYSELVEAGFEGLILKQSKSKYTFKRSKDWIKLKEVIECDLTCIDYEEGTGQYEGAIGSLVCTGTVHGKLNNVGLYKDFEVTVKVSGLTAALRNKNPDYFIGHTIEVKYNQIIQDEVTGKYSLFAPRFKAKRFDK